MAATKRATKLRMTWDASSIEVASFHDAVQEARRLGLNSFGTEEWDSSKDAWVFLGFWAWDSAGRLVSIPASEGNE